MEAGTVGNGMQIIPVGRNQKHLVVTAMEKESDNSIFVVIVVRIL